MFRLGGIRKLQNSMSGGIVRFYVRGSDGRFTSTKVTFMPKAPLYNGEYYDSNDVIGVYGEMLFVNHRGFIVQVKQPRGVQFNSINFQSVKVVV